MELGVKLPKKISDPLRKFKITSVFSSFFNTFTLNYVILPSKIRFKKNIFKSKRKPKKHDFMLEKLYFIIKSLIFDFLFLLKILILNSILEGKSIKK